jgi:hypothetical protein
MARHPHPLIPEGQARKNPLWIMGVREGLSLKRSHPFSIERIYYFYCLTMQEIKQIGNTGWTYDDIRASCTEFLELYKRKPISDNQGGMKTPHMFATWYMLRKLKPENVIESGVWKGQGTWLIEQALPEANIYSIDLNLDLREYKSDKVHYFNHDFTTIDWSVIADKKNTVLFFDDHQNALDRIKKGKEFGFKQFIFEDNYPALQGDCYSLKKAFQHSGFKPKQQRRNISTLLKSWLFRQEPGTIQPNSHDAGYLEKTLDIYLEFPPVFRNPITRWGDAWNDENYPTPEPLYTDTGRNDLSQFKEDMLFYTWICYARIR